MGYSGDAFDSLEVANLSLDDSELEVEIIKEDGVDKDQDIIDLRV